MMDKIIDQTTTGTLSRRAYLLNKYASDTSGSK